jgi:hypothetical protein
VRLLGLYVYEYDQCIYVCAYVCMSVCMFVCMDACMYACINSFSISLTASYASHTDAIEKQSTAALSTNPAVPILSLPTSGRVRVNLIFFSYPFPPLV